jgi:hypothetical protein
MWIPWGICIGEAVSPLLDCETLSNGRVRSRLLSSATSSEFYSYQVSGAIGCLLKLYGTIDIEAVLIQMDKGDDPSADSIRAAAGRLRDLTLHGCILADEVGFGKTKESLLVALIHSMVYAEKSKETIPKDLHRPILLLVPPTLIGQWLKEIQTFWRCFRPVVSYSDCEMKNEMALATIPHQAIVEYPSMEAMPLNLRFVFDATNNLARDVIIVTSYETHKVGTMVKKSRMEPGVPYSNPPLPPTMAA